MPADRSPDSTFALLRAGYRFIGERCERYGSDVFKTRILLAPTICLRGRPAAELFYDNDRFQRATAMPLRVQRTLTGRGGVQGLDGPEHSDRKAMFMSIMTPSAIQRLGQLFDDEWRTRVAAWESAGPVSLYDELGLMLTRARIDRGSLYVAAEGETFAVNTERVSNPISERCRFTRLRSSIPALHSIMTASATSAATSARRMRRDAAWLDVRAPSLSVSAGASRDARTAGTSPNSTPVTKDVSSAYPSTTRIEPDLLDARDLVGGASATSARVPPHASNRPSAPPVNANTVDSVSSWTRTPTMRRA